MTVITIMILLIIIIILLSLAWYRALHKVLKPEEARLDIVSVVIPWVFLREIFDEAVGVEHLLLMRFDPETTKQDKAKSSIENVWSLQYRVGGVICSSAGKSVQEKVKNGLEATRLDVQVRNRSCTRLSDSIHFTFYKQTN